MRQKTILPNPPSVTVRIAVVVGVLAWLPAMGRFAQAQELADTNPHGPLRAELSCVSCHTTTGWQPVRTPMDFSHADDAGFALTGSHRRVNCASCHIDLQFGEPAVAEEACASCHLDVHQGALAGACNDCHTTASFNDVQGMVAHLQTRFPLTGAHEQVACHTCHTDDRDGAFAPLETACDACHHEAYAATTLIDHAALSFSTDCEACHSTVSWSGTGFDHEQAAGGFPLLGSHQIIACASCHVLPGFGLRFTPADASDCISCHESDYQREHAGTGFSTTCLDCHSTDSFDDATFDHDDLYFPIYSGEHRGEWNNECQTCHTVPGNFMAFTCLNCHEHRQSSMDSEHRGIRNYAYDSASCFSCHPDGREDD